MRVVPVRQVDENPASSHAGEKLFNVDLVIVIDDTVEAVAPQLHAALFMKGFLHLVIGFEKIFVTTLRNGWKTPLKSESIVFLMHERGITNESSKDIWLRAMTEKSPGVDIKHFSVYLLHSPLSEPSNTFCKREISDYDNVFEWWPFLLRCLFGTTGTVPKRPKIIDIAVNKEKSAEYIVAVNKMLDELEVKSENKTSEDHILLFCDTVQACDQQKFRNAKLEGCLTHALSTDSTSTSSANLRWFSSRQDSKSMQKYILTLMLDMRLITVPGMLNDTRKVPAIPIQAPIRFDKSTLSTIKLRWDKLKEFTEVSRIVVKQRSSINPEWTQISETLKGDSSSFIATDLQQDERYQFALIVESVDDVSEPTYSEWFAVEVSDNQVQKLLIKMSLIVLMIFVIILDIPQCLLLIGALAVMAVLTILLFLLLFVVALNSLFHPKVVEGLHAKASLPTMWKNNKVIIVCMYVFFFVYYLSAAWLIPDVNTEGGKEHIQFTSPIYIVPPVFMLLWAIIANIVSYKYFDCKYGVLSIPGHILTLYKETDAGAKIQIYPSSGIETI